MTNGKPTTGTRDEIFDLVSVLYHTLQSAETCAQYIKDAEQGGDTDLAQFFRTVQDEDKRRANRAMQLLIEQLSSSAPGPAEIGKIYDL
jgi:hypothetical protein